QVSGLAEGAQGQTSWTVSTPLLNGQLYFWVAVVTDEHGASTVGEAASFIVSMSNTAPSEPAILSPNVGEVITTTHVVLVSNNAFDSERQELSYFFELDTVNTFDSANKRVSGAVAEGNSRTQWAVSGLVEGQTYYWRVKAFDGSAESGWAT